MNHKLSPSDLTFLYDGCRRCFYLKVRMGLSPPSIPLPSIFTKIAGLLKTHYDGKRTEKLHPGLPPGVVKYGEVTIQSDVLRLAGRRDTCFIKGRFDVVVGFDDGSYGVIDYKTGNPESKFSSLYGRQLHGYAYALEHPSAGSIRLAPVSLLGLLYFRPSEVSQRDVSRLSFDSDIHYVPIERNDGHFMRFIDEVLGILESPEPPAPARDCQWCGYLSKLGR